jgi:hypothetical protein
VKSRKEVKDMAFKSNLLLNKDQAASEEAKMPNSMTLEWLLYILMKLKFSSTQKYID